MNRWREVLTGILAAFISIAIIGGSYAVATSEGRPSLSINMSLTPTLTSFPTHIIMVTQRPGEPTFTPSPTPLPPSPTPTQYTASCSPPAGWSVIVLQPGDSLDSLADSYNTSKNTLKNANCLVGNSLVPGTIFYVPGTPPPTAVPCGPPSNWVYYIVNKGDTLYSIGRAYGVSAAQLQAANCMGSSTTIRVGQKLYVPNVHPILPSSTPSPTDTQTPEPTDTPTQIPASVTPSVVPPSITPTIIPPSPTPTFIIPTDTPDGLTETPLPTDTPDSPPPTFTFTPSPELTLVPTDIPTITTPPTSTPYPNTLTPVPTFTPTPTP